MQMRHQFFVATDFPGGIYASPTMLGTRPGGPIAAAWAALQALGEDGYIGAREATAVDAADRLRAGIAAIPGLVLLGRGDATIVAYAARRDLDVYAIADRLEARGWTVDRQQRPASIHLTVTANHAPIVDEYLADLARGGRRGARAIRRSRSAAPRRCTAWPAKMPLRRLVASQRAQGDRGHVRDREARREADRVRAHRAGDQRAVAGRDDARRLRERPLPRGRRAAARGRPTAPRSPGFFKRAELAGFIARGARAQRRDRAGADPVGVGVVGRPAARADVLRDARGRGSSRALRRAGPARRHVPLPARRDGRARHRRSREPARCAACARCSAARRSWSRTISTAT